MRLAFQYFGNDTWIAGNLFLENILVALRALGAECPILVLVADQNTTSDEFGGLAAHVDEVLRGPAPLPDHDKLLGWSLQYHLNWWLRTRLLRYPTRVKPHPLSAFLAVHHIDCFFTEPWTESPFDSVPSVVWIPDFQHVRLPEMFPAEERARRDRLFQAQARSATRLLITSEAVRLDLQAFAPQQSEKARLIRFVAHIPAEIYDCDPRDGLAPYHLPEKFIYLPNQFWKHKNHPLVFEALAQLGAVGIRPIIVSTGNPIDFRQPSYFAELMQTLSRLNIREQFIFLGQVPRSDVYRLIRQSVCVLNPSKFEGLGLSVAEAKSLGKRVVVSDLGALREQNMPGAAYFDPGDAGDLAAKLAAVWNTIPPGPDGQLESEARAELPGRQVAFGQALVEIFQEAQTQFHGASAH